MRSAPATRSRQRSPARARAAPTTPSGTRSTGTTSMETEPGPAPNATSKQEPILQSDEREIRLLVADQNLSVTEACYPAGEQVAGRHVHARHTDAFYVLEGELTFEIGPESETVTLGAGGFV